MSLVFVMVMCLIPPVEASAASKKPFFSKNIEFIYYEKKKDANIEFHTFGDEGVNYKITKMKSSNKKVMNMSRIFDGENTLLKLKAQKPGKATITFKATVGNKTYNYKVKVKVIKYENPLKVLKIGKKDYAAKFAQEESYGLCKKNLEGKLAIKASPNWKIDSIHIWDYNKNKHIKVKNNKKISLKKEQSLCISVSNKKTGQWTVLNLMNSKWN